MSLIPSHNRIEIPRHEKHEVYEKEPALFPFPPGAVIEALDNGNLSVAFSAILEHYPEFKQNPDIVKFIQSLKKKEPEEMGSSEDLPPTAETIEQLLILISSIIAYSNDGSIFQNIFERIQEQIIRPHIKNCEMTKRDIPIIPHTSRGSAALIKQYTEIEGLYFVSQMS